MYFTTTWSTPSNSLPVGGACVEVMESHEGIVQGGRLPSHCRQLLVLFPGNPGVVHFYHKFVHEFIRRFPESCVLVMGFAGHSLDELNQHRVFELQEQFELANEFLKMVFTQLIKDHTGGQNPRGAAGARDISVCIGGHSIGSLVAMETTARFPRIQRCFMLTPTICHMVDSPNGRRNKHVLRDPIIHCLGSCVAPVLGSMPTFMQKGILHLAEPEMDAAAKGLVMNMARGYLVKNILFMASSEFRQLGSIDEPLLKEVENRLVFYFVKKDGWVPLCDVEEIKEKAPNAAGMVMEEDSDVAHAWCLRHNHQVIENGIAPFFPPTGPVPVSATKQQQ